jgi:iron complex transport system ATP-binding protein
LRGPNNLAAVDHALDLLDLVRMRGRLYRELSGGERQKVQLARLLAQDADLLLLDEPTAGLDLDWQERLTSLVEELHDRTGVAVVMVTHEAHHLPGCCEKVLLLRNGRAVAAGTPSEVFTPDLLSELYGCRIEVMERQGRYFAHSLGPAEGSGR